MDELTRSRIAEILPLARGDSVPDAVAVAIAVEQCFGVVLADADIGPECLCTRDALINTLIRYVDGQ